MDCSVVACLAVSLDANNTFIPTTVVETKNISRRCHMSLVAVGVVMESLILENHCPKWNNQVRILDLTVTQNYRGV